MDMQLNIDNISCGYGAKTVVSGISLEIKSGESLCLLGPNGVGKTTFFKTILGLLKLQSGRILLNNEDINNWSRQKIATKVGYVPQAHTPPFPFRVFDVVVMGRIAHLSMFASPSQTDRKIAVEALHMLDIDYLRDKVYTEISGGERQMVLIARALTQQPELLIMDEPTANLDFGNQIKVLSKIKKLVQQGYMGVVMTTHFPDHAFFCGSKVAVMGWGNQFLVGNANEVITETYLKEVYDVHVKICNVGENGKELKVCVPYEI